MKYRNIINCLLLILIILFLLGCDQKNNAFKPEKINANHSFYNSDFASFLKISSDVLIENDKLTPRYAITIHMRVSRGTERKIMYYQIDWISADDGYDTYYHIASVTDDRYVGQRFLPPSTVGDDAIKKVKAYFKYCHTVDGVAAENEYAYSEEIIAFPGNEFSSDISELQNKVDLGIVLNDDDSDDYRFKFYISFLNHDIPSHIDYQSWYETDNGSVLPLIGIYNYATLGDDYLSISDEKITKEITIKNIYMKLVYYDGDNVYNGQYKVSIDELQTA
ncbi:MAG: hypothetical protein M0R05_00555 [Bacilli bacterium]|nr:hypothetical protein [Bacilli bacterium]MDD4076458.1 hypothetical protein [Bacilli bacterium]MDD4388253.1 hypothetical protein [Bacilli bacterium]